ncbi:MAG: family 43 glycosylhydrolase, partial [Thermoguttaceae bacterium]|nr:family 43 glycosylhydrolase [Thermoguttaceae bacterium]
MLRSFFFNSFICLLALSCSAAEYSNPVLIRNFRGRAVDLGVADPSVIQGDDGWLYAFSTNRVVLKSRDGCAWQIHSRNVIPRPAWGDEYYGRPINAGVWAPDVRKVQGRWIYYYSLSAWGLPCGIGYAVAENAGGPYVDQGKLFNCTEIGIENCIDPQVFVEDDGSV